MFSVYYLVFNVDFIWVASYSDKQKTFFILKLCQCLATSAPAAAAKSLQSCPTLCDPIDGSPPGSPIPGILQARTLEWGAIPFSSAWKWKVKVKSHSRVRLFATPWTAAYQAPLPVGFSRREHWSGVPLPSPHLPLVVSFNPWDYIFVYYLIKNKIKTNMFIISLAPSQNVKQMLIYSDSFYRLTRQEEQILLQYSETVRNVLFLSIYSWISLCLPVYFLYKIIINLVYYL